jgi:phosphoglycolate phosphatase-like HAD superfamily hydrolase
MFSSLLVVSSVLCIISKASSFSTLITFDVDGTLVSSSPGWEEGAHGRSFTHAVNAVLIKKKDGNSSSAHETIPQLLEKHEFHGSTDGLILMRLARKLMGASLFDKDDASAKLDLMMDTMYGFVSECNDDEIRKGIAPLPGTIQTLETLASYEDVAFGLVTGNVEGIARRKMDALGIYDTGVLTSLSQPPRLGGRVWEGMEHKRFLGGFGSDFCSGNIDDPERNYLDRGEQLAICVQRCIEELCPPNSQIERVIHVGESKTLLLEDF